MKGYEPVAGGDDILINASQVPLAVTDDVSMPVDGDMSAEADVQGQALNGAQLSSLQGIVQAVADGLLPSASAIELIMVGFPRLSREDAARLVSPASNFTPATLSKSDVKAIVYGPKAD
jgi:hypothetical protein